MTRDRDEVLSVFRRNVLAALDQSARDTLGPRAYSRNDSGATDADLPRLFKAIDAQVEVLSERFGVYLLDRAETDEAI